MSFLLASFPQCVRSYCHPRSKDIPALRRHRWSQLPELFSTNSLPTGRYLQNTEISSRVTWSPLCIKHTWWRHRMEPFSALLAICAGNSPVTDQFPAKRPVTRNFGVLFDLCLTKRFSTQWSDWWFETPWRPLWRHCNELATILTLLSVI